MDWSLRLLEDQLRLDPPPAQKIAAIQDHLERISRLETIAEAHKQLPRGTEVEVQKMKYFRLEAEQKVLEVHAAHPDVPLSKRK